MVRKEDIQLKLGEYRAQYTGKDPFGPWADLKRLYETLDSDGRVVLAQVLAENRKDEFWKDFIELFERGAKE